MEYGEEIEEDMVWPQRRSQNGYCMPTVSKKKISAKEDIFPGRCGRRPRWNLEKVPKRISIKKTSERKRCKQKSNRRRCNVFRGGCARRLG